MVLTRIGAPLRSEELPDPALQPGQIRLAVEACGVCRTDLHVADGDLPRPTLPLILGHEIVGSVIAAAPDVTRFRVGDRVGIPWLGWTCGTCAFCSSGRENLCDRARFTGYQLDGGYATRAVANAAYAIGLPGDADAVSTAPLLCAGLIGFRAFKASGPARRLGLYGFGAAAHILCQLARQEGREVFAFTRPGDDTAQGFALSLGAAWAGGSDESPPAPLDAAIIFAPVGALVPAALRAVEKGGTVVCAGIHMTDIPAFPYEEIWGERVLRSVANLTRSDGAEFFALLRDRRIQVRTHPYLLEEANEAMNAVRKGRVDGAAVLVPGSRS